MLSFILFLLLFVIDHLRPHLPIALPAIAVICRYYSRTEGACMFTVNIRKKPMNSSFFLPEKVSYRRIYCLISSYLR